MSAFRSLGANVGTALRKGEPVTVYGRQRISTWERSDGSTGTSVEVEAYAVGHDLTVRHHRVLEGRAGPVLRR